MKIQLEVSTEAAEELARAEGGSLVKIAVVEDSPVIETSEAISEANGTPVADTSLNDSNLSIPELMLDEDMDYSEVHDFGTLLRGIFLPVYSPNLIHTDCVHNCPFCGKFYKDKRQMYAHIQECPDYAKVGEEEGAKASVSPLLPNEKVFVTLCAFGLSCIMQKGKARSRKNQVYDLSWIDLMVSYFCIANKW